MTFNLQVSSPSTLDMRAAATQNTSHQSFTQRVREKINQWMASPTVYRMSVSNVFTRWFAVRRTKQVFDLMAGFVNFQVLFTCLKTGVLDAAYDSPLTLLELSKHTNLEEKNLEPLILSAVALGLLEHRGGGRFGIGPLGLPVIAYGGVRVMVEHNSVLYKDMVDTVGLIGRKSKSEMNEYWPYAKFKNSINATQVTAPDSDAYAVTVNVDVSVGVGDGPGVGVGVDVGAPIAVGEPTTSTDPFARYSELMSASQNFVIDEILSAYDFSAHKNMLDIGCGKGRFVSAVAEQNEHLKFELMDLPQVIEITRAKLEQASFIHRVGFNPGSFKTHDLPSQVDLVTMVRIAHDHSDEVVAALFRKIYLALPPRGVLLVAEPMAEPTGKGAKHDAYFHFYLLAMGEGRLRTPEALSQMMFGAGFGQVKALPNPMPIHAKILAAYKN